MLFSKLCDFFDIVNSIRDALHPAFQDGLGIIKSPVIEIGAYFFSNEIEQELRIKLSDFAIQLFSEIKLNLSSDDIGFFF